MGGTTGPLSTEATFDVQIAGRLGVPAGASAIAVNVTVVDPLRAGYATVSPAGTLANASNVNPSSAGHTVANLAIVRLSAGGAVSVYTYSGGQVLLDVAGYWLPATSATSGRYTPMTPTRVLDTRQAGGTKVAPGGVINATVAGTAGVPADASAVAVNVTAVEASGWGFLTAWAAGEPKPDASISNQLPGSTVANTAIVPVGANGQISIYSYGGAHILIDIAGWFTGESAPTSTDGLFVPVDPTRIADTRQPSAPLRKLQAGMTQELPISIPGGVPFGTEAGAVAVNLTIADPVEDGFLTASPGWVPVPNASNLNFTTGKAVAGLSLSRIGANGSLNLTSFSSGHVIADIAGWFTGAPAPDGGFRPTRCENVMQYMRDNGGDSRSVMVSDRTVAGSARATVTSDKMYASVSPRCEYVLLFRLNPDGETSRVSRIDVLGSQPEKSVLAAEAWDAWTISADGWSIFWIETDLDAFTMAIHRLDILTGADSVIFAGDAAGYDVSDVSRDGRTLDFTAAVPGGFLLPYRLDLVTGGVVSLQAYDWTWTTESSLAGIRATVINQGGDNDDAAVLLPGGWQVHPMVYRVRFTPQNELVESVATGPVRILTDPGSPPGTVLLDNVTNYSPNFPKFALV